MHIEFGKRLRFGFGRSLPLILQTEAAECGLACLAMVAHYHGHETDLQTLRRRFPLSMKGATLERLLNVGSALSLAGRPLRVELDQLAELSTPCILHWDFKHFVVLKAATQRGVVIHDPSLGVKVYAEEEVSKHFTGVVLELVPTPEFQSKKKDKRVRLRDLMGVVRGLKKSLVQIFLLALVLQLFALISPFFIQLVVDSVTTSGDKTLLTSLAFGFGLLVFIQVCIGVVRSWVVLYFSTHLRLQWTANIFGHLVRLPVSYFERRYLGDIASRFGAINAIQHSATTSFIESMLDGTTVVLVFVMMLVYSPVLAGLSVVGAFLYATMRWFSFAPLRMAAKECIVLQARQHSHLLETLRGIQSIKLFGRENERRARWMNLLVDSSNRDIQIQKWTVMSRGVNGLLFGLESVITLWLGGNLVIDNALSVGMLFAYLSYRGQFIGRIGNLVDQSVEHTLLQLQGERLADIVLTPRETDNEDPAIIVGAGKNGAVLPSIEVRNVSFRYAEGEPWILRNCSLKISEGEAIAIVGSSGCGKTTLLKIMLGLLDPTEGEILVGGINIRQLGTRTYRKLIGAVMQDDQLLAGSIADNISFFDAAPDEQRIETVARLAAIHDEITEMPMRYNTLIGDMGTAISGGQRQRLVLARALYKKPLILFLDEATSHLDSAKEHLVNSEVRRLKLTRIMIAHRQETIKMADRVVELSKGSIIKDMRQIPQSIASKRGS